AGQAARRRAGALAAPAVAAGRAAICTEAGSAVPDAAPAVGATPVLPAAGDPAPAVATADPAARAAAAARDPPGRPGRGLAARIVASKVADMADPAAIFEAGDLRLSSGATYRGARLSYRT